MGYAVRTERYRYVEWRETESDKLVAPELYDHTSDPNEMRNLAMNPAHATKVHELSEMLASGWRSALPTP